MIHNTMIYLIGLRGVGKLTIAKALSEQVSLKRIDNHLINDPIFSLYDLKNGVTDQMWHHIDQIREIVFQAITQHPDKTQNFVFTNELISGEVEDEALYQQVLSVAESRHACFVPVILHCDLDVLKARITSPERQNTYKDTSLDSVDSLCKNGVMVPEHDNLLQIDTTRKLPEQIAPEIIQHCQKVTI